MSDEPPEGGAARSGHGGPESDAPGTQPGQQPYGTPYPQQPAGGYGQVTGHPPYGHQEYPAGREYGGDPRHGAGPRYGATPPYGAGPQYGGGPPYGAAPSGAGQYGAGQYGAGQYGAGQYGAGQYGAGQYGAPYPPPHGAYPGHPGPPGGTSPDPLVPFSLGDWFGKVIATVQRSWKPLLVVQALILVPALLLQVVLVVSGIGGGFVLPGRGALAGTAVLVLLFGILSVAVSALGAMAAVFVTVRDAARRPYTRDQVIAFVRNRAVPAIGWTAAVAAAAGAAVAVLVLAFGPFLAVLPILAGALYAGTVLTALPGVVGVERGGIGRVVTLVHRRFFPTLGRFALFGLAACVAGFVIGLVGAAVGVVSPLAGALVNLVLALPIGVVGTAVVVVLYAENRFHEDHAVHTPVLADEIDRP
ncbi:MULTISPECIES: hypothetical protein [unclassified Pseudonocardia]|uniref:hypothetical protein n=1 Tax=unclassified Pseudonocardia TaxID=2619320 RepID=UPI0005258A2A|nr:hypothetical protein [Pseudonocardia sp. Ae707_Ps1]OLM19124.1 DedA protein [Pseudonocardia sp. Ae707_Ps1]